MSIPSRRFVIHSPIRNLETFRHLAEQAAQLKSHGEVVINISTLAEKSWYEIPDGGSPWHEYASLNPTLFKFFPHPVLEPYIPEASVNKNRESLLAKAEILREYSIQPGFWSYDPNILPEQCFIDHPYLRGPRVDHPRRSKEEAFTLCVDREDVLDMYTWMMAELIRHVPELSVYSFKTNDAGTGLCWSENLYSGPNGPQPCRSQPVGIRVKKFLESLLQGAQQSGSQVDIYMSGYITENELDHILPHLPPRTFLEARTNTAMTIGSLINTTFPVLGVFDPVSVLSTMERLKSNTEINTIFIGLRAMYDRGHETIETSQQLFTLMDDYLKIPVYGLMPRLQRLHALCAKWGGEDKADALFEGFVSLHDTLRIKSAAAAQLGTYSGGVTQRWITRPLVIKPDLLTAEEEAYFLPYVFNIHEEEARQDYIDLAGSRLIPDCLPPTRDDPRLPAIHSVVKQLLHIANIFEDTRETPAGVWLRSMSNALKFWASMLRTANNFYGVQIIRDRCAAVLSGEPRRPDKIPTWTGDPSLLAFNDIRRDEFDNTLELIRLIENNGLDLIARAESAGEADSFLLEADLIKNLHNKIEIMRDHWLDGEKYLTPPFK